MERVYKLQEDTQREGSRRNEFIGRMSDAVHHGRSPGAPLDYLYPSGRYVHGVSENKIENKDETPVWEPPHYRRPWDSIPVYAPPFDPANEAGLIYPEGYDPAFDGRFGYGTERFVPREAWQVDPNVPGAARFPF